MVVIFQGGEGSGPLCPPSGSAHAHTHSLARAFTACLLKLKNLSTPSPKDVDCILASYIAYRSSNKTQFCSMVVHEHHKSDLSDGSDEFAHFARIQKVLPEGSDFDNVFFFLVDEVRDDPNTPISGPTSAHQRNAI